VRMYKPTDDGDYWLAKKKKLNKLINDCMMI